MLTAREIVIAALEIDPAQRAEYLTQACGADPDLLEEVQALLKTRGKGTAQDSTVTIHSNFQEAIADRSIGPYNLVRQLGEGGMGVVYHAQQLQPIRRDVALKIIKPGMDSKQVIARFESERQALAMMDHG